MKTNTINAMLGFLFTALVSSTVLAQCFLGILDDGPSGSGHNVVGPHKVAFAGDYLYAGSPWESAPFGGRGMVRVYQRDGDDWNLAWKLLPPNPNNARTFGQEIQPLDDDLHILVGEPQRSKVWELRYEQGAWKVVREILPPDDDIHGFGTAIVYENGTLAIGAPSSDIVYIYERQNDAWVLDRRAKPQADLQVRGYGHSLALDDDLLLVGARSSDAVELWIHGGFNWNRTATLHHPDPDEEVLFGFAVAFHQGLALVSDLDQQTNGVVHIYRFQGGGFGWVYEDTLRPWDTDEWDWAEFGYDIDSHGDTILVQAQHALDFNGATYAFQSSMNQGWQPYFKITPRTPSSHMDTSSIAIQGDLLAVGGEGSLSGLAPVEFFSLRPRCLCIADFNEDGRINPSDVTTFLNAWNARDPASDANADGLINTQDVAWFLHEWNTREHCVS